MTLRILQGDCLEVMKTLTDKSVDCFICDLPYGCLTGDGKKEQKRKRFINGKDTGTEIKQTEGVIAGCSWDVKLDLEKFWEQIERLMKNENVPIIHFCNMRFGVELIQSKPKWFRYDIVWEKTNAVGFLSANKQPLRAHENIFVFSKKGAYYNRKDIEGDFKTVESKRCLRSVIKSGIAKKKNQHPTQKPLDLYSMLIERYCPPDGTVLDPTAGSFNSCFAARALGRKAIGIEMNKQFYDKAVKRAEDEVVTPSTDATTT